MLDINQPMLTEASVLPNDPHIIKNKFNYYHKVEESQVTFDYVSCLFLLISFINM